MDGVELNPLKIVENRKGDIFHVIKASSNMFSKFGEAYFSEIKYQEIKGWKLHKEMILNLVVPVGEVQFVIYNGSSYFSIILSKSNYQRLTISPNLWVAFKGLSTKSSLILNIASIEHNPDEAINKNLEEIKYNW